RLCIHRIAAAKHEETRACVSDVGFCRQNTCFFFGSERSHHHRSLCCLPVPGRIEIMTAIRQEVRPVVSRLSGFQTGDRLRLSAFSRYAEQPRGGTEQDGSLAVPCAPQETR